MLRALSVMIFFRFFFPQIETSFTARAVYHLSGAGNDNDDVENATVLDLGDDLDQDQDFLSNLEIAFEWPRPRSLLQKPTVDAQTILKVRVVPGTTQKILDTESVFLKHFGRLSDYNVTDARTKERPKC